MRKFLIGAMVLAASVIPATAASAQPGYGYGHGGGYYGHNRGDRVRQEIRECRRELRNADSRWEYRRELRECRREIAQARYGYRGHRGGGHRW